MRRSSSGRKWRTRPWIGQAAASPSAQMVWPSTCLVTSSSLSMSRDLGVAFAQPLHHPPHPAGALAARRALAAALMLVEIADAADRADDVGRLVHDDHRRGAEAGAERLQPVEVHRRVHDLGRRHQRHRRSARDHRQQIVPAAADAAGMAVDQLAEADRPSIPRPRTGVFTWPEIWNSLVPSFFGLPMPANHSGAAAQDGRHDRDASRHC